MHAVVISPRTLHPLSTPGRSGATSNGPCPSCPALARHQSASSLPIQPVAARQPGSVQASQHSQHSTAYAFFRFARPMEPQSFPRFPFRSVIDHHLLINLHLLCTFAPGIVHAQQRTAQHMAHISNLSCSSAHQPQYRSPFTGATAATGPPTRANTSSC